MQENNTKAADTAEKAMRKLFYGRLEELLKEQGQTKKEEQWTYLDVSKSTLQNWKNGLALPRPPELVRIAHKLGCSVDYLIDETVTVRTAATDIQAAVKTTGLSERAVEVLENCQSCGAVKILNTVNSLIVSDISVYQMKEGKWENGNRPNPWNKLTGYNASGAVVQGNGLIAALQNNLEASAMYENERERLLRLTKDNPDPEDMREWFLQDEKTAAAQTRLKVSGYDMTVACTTATAEGQQYHETLKAEYQKGGLDNGEH